MKRTLRALDYEVLLYERSPVRRGKQVLIPVLAPPDSTRRLLTQMLEEAREHQWSLCDPQLGWRIPPYDVGLAFRWLNEVAQFREVVRSLLPVLEPRLDRLEIR